MGDRNTKIIYNTGALYLRMALTMVISFFTARVTLSVLGVENYGLNNLVGGLVAMFSFVNLSMGTAVQRFYSIEIGKKEKGRLANVFGSGLYIHLLIAGLTLLVAEVFAFFFLGRMNIPQERMLAAHIVFQISILSLLLNIINVPYAAFLRAKEEFSKMAIVDIFQALSRLLVLYFLCRINFDKLIVFSLLNFAVTLLYVIAINKLARKFSETSFYINKDKALLKEMLSFTSLIILSVFAKLFRDQGIIVLINLFFGLAINAAYAVAISVQNMLESFTLSFKQSVVPQIMSSYGESNLDRMNKLIYTATKITFLLSLLITMPVIFEAHYILKLWLVEPPLYSDKFVSIVLGNLIIFSFPFFLSQGIQATGDIKKLQIWSSFNLMFNVLIAFIILKLGGNFYSIIYIGMFTSVVSNTINMYYARKHLSLNVNSFFRQVLVKCVYLLIVLTLVLFLVNRTMEPSLIRLLSIVFLTLIIVCGGGYFLILNFEEKKMVRQMLSRFYS